jgi:hypothetical protein
VEQGSPPVAVSRIKVLSSPSSYHLPIAFEKEKERESEERRGEERRGGEERQARSTLGGVGGWEKETRERPGGK